MPFFQWTPQAYAATYLVEIYKNGDTNFSPANKVLSAITKFSAWAPTTSLATGDYAWRVRRNDADNRAGPWSNARTLALAAAKPSLVCSRERRDGFGQDAALHLDGASPAPFSTASKSRATCSFSPLTSSQVTVMTSVGADHGVRQWLVLLAGRRPLMPRATRSRPRRRERSRSGRPRLRP